MDTAELSLMPVMSSSVAPQETKLMLLEETL